jgi:CheY-like chemotaxis protein
MSAKKILVVDDDADYQAAVRQILEDGGYEVVSAFTKEEGLESLKEHDPDLIVLDIMMTRSTDGFFFLYEMRAKPEGKKPPVLSISVIAKETGMEFSPTSDGDYFPADDFLSKPVDPDELRKHVRDLLAGWRPPKPSAGP